MPFFRSFVVAMRVCASSVRLTWAAGLAGRERPLRADWGFYTRRVRCSERTSSQRHRQAAHGIPTAASFELPGHLQAHRDLGLPGVDRPLVSGGREHPAAVGLETLLIESPALDLCHAQHRPERVAGCLAVALRLRRGLLDGVIAGSRPCRLRVTDLESDLVTAPACSTPPPC